MFKLTPYELQPTSVFVNGRGFVSPQCAHELELCDKQYRLDTLRKHGPTPKQLHFLLNNTSSWTELCHNLIQRRAYEIWQRDGNQDADANWFKAIQELENVLASQLL